MSKAIEGFEILGRAVSKIGDAMLCHDMGKSRDTETIAKIRYILDNVSKELESKLTK